MSDVAPGQLVSELCAVLGARPTQGEPLRGYQQHVQLVDTSEGVQASRCHVLWQHPKSPDRVYISANGPGGEAARLYLQTEEIPHDVSRYDSAVDLVMSDGQFARRHSALVRLAGGIGKPIRPIGTVERGRTLELNAHVKTAISSPHKRLPEAQVMFYEKGKQLGADPAWKRVELRLRPGKPEAKLAAAALEPSAVWGVFQWTRDVLGCATQGMTSADPAEYPRFRVALPEVEAELRRIRAMKGLEQMAHQYGRTVETLVEFMGEDEAWELIRKRFRGERPEQTPAEAYADLWAPLPTGGKVH